MPNKTVKLGALVGAVVALASGLAMAQSQTFVQQTLTGTVTCEGRVTHQYTCQRNQTQQTCTLACVERGSHFVLLVGDKPYLLEGDRRDLEAYAGGAATVTGVAVNDHIEVQAASNAKHNMNDLESRRPSAMANPSN
jgi:hypothetical protein